MGTLILMRHGQSQWNEQNLFTGWVDVPLSSKGIDEAFDGGERISHLSFDRIYTSTLVRAQMTVFLAMSRSKMNPTLIVKHLEGKEAAWEKIYNEAIEKKSVPVFFASQLNERMYGALQGQNKAELMEKFGKEKVQIWRRSFAVAPPEGESLKMTAERTLPYFDKEIFPWIEKGQTVLIGAHGNSLRSIIMKIEGLSEDEVVHLELLCGEPLCYEWKSGKWQKKSISTME